MGVYHFAAVGRWPGAVTTALAYLKHNKEAFITRGPVIETIVLFTTPEIMGGTVKASEVIFNDYQSQTARKTVKSADVLDTIVEFVKTELLDILPPGARVVCCELDDAGKYESCFETVAKAVLKFAPPGQTGKNIWANLTGGTNVVNAALMQTASLSGLISRLYYTFLAESSEQKYLQPVSSDPLRFRWEDVPLLKTAIDPVYYQLLRVLQGLGEGWYLDEALLGKLQSAAWEKLPQELAAKVGQMDLAMFRKEYLNKLDGRELQRERQESHAVRLSEIGQQLLTRLQTPLYRALIERGLNIADEPDPRDFEADALTAGLKIEELWRR